MNHRDEGGLHQRYVYALFVCGVAFSGAMFLLGVFVGKQLERSTPKEPAVADPLAALDAIADAETADEALEFPTLVATAVPAPSPAATTLPAPTPKPTAKSTAMFTLHVAGFSNRTQAENFAEQMTKQDYKPRVLLDRSSQQRPVYRVRLGEYATQEAALRAKKQFERRHKKAASISMVE